jgi:hypothetical protein
MSNKFPLIVRQHFTIKQMKAGFNLSCDDCKNDENDFSAIIANTMPQIQIDVDVNDLINHIHRIHPQTLGDIAIEEDIVNATTTDAIIPPTASVKTVEEINAYIDNIDLSGTQTNFHNNSDTVPMESVNTIPSPVATEMFHSVFKIERLRHSCIVFPVVEKSTLPYNEVKEEANGKLNVVVRGRDKKHGMILGMRLFDNYIKNKK